MLYINTESTIRPNAVLLERLGDGSANVRLADNIREKEREGEKVIVYDEVVFTLTADRKETAADIEAEFAAWWAYGSAPEEAEPTTEERLEIVESVLMDLIGGAM